ncbi:MAG: enoyl-CoA hydratase [Comamonadaceae bacterium]|nr:MAG: enoyl-CoA hydratase [Comamonadaceae bacterium]
MHAGPAQDPAANAEERGEPAFTQLRYEVDGHVATLTFDRPARLNAWTPTLERELRTALAMADADREVRCIVLTGAGRAFCAGADMERLAALSSDTQAPPAFEAPAGEPLAQRYSYLMGLATPVIAAINGPAAGVGVCLSLFCDLRFMAAGAKLSVPYARRGVAAEYGVAWILPRLIGPLNAADLLFTGRTVTAEEAAAMGLVRLLPADGFIEAVRARARDIATLSSPRSVRSIKQQLWQGLHQTLPEAALLADRAMAAAFGTEDFREGVAHFVEKRTPRFTGH